MVSRGRMKSRYVGTKTSRHGMSVSRHPTAQNESRLPSCPLIMRLGPRGPTGFRTRAASASRSYGCSCSPRSPSTPPRLARLKLDLDIDARRQLPHQHQRVHCLRRRLQDVDQPLVRADLELLPRVLSDVRRADQAELLYLF